MTLDSHSDCLSPAVPGEDTNYHFDVAWDALEPALDRFAQVSSQHCMTALVCTASGCDACNCAGATRTGSKPQCNGDASAARVQCSPYHLFLLSFGVVRARDV